MDYILATLCPIPGTLPALIAKKAAEAAAAKEVCNNAKEVYDVY